MATHQVRFLQPCPSGSPGALVAEVSMVLQGASHHYSEDLESLIPEPSWHAARAATDT
ncbi:MAG: hypothetical protein ACRDRP_09380 [Pseudonocardiaceae bacterium]